MQIFYLSAQLKDETNQKNGKLQTENAANAFNLLKYEINCVCVCMCKLKKQKKKRMYKRIRES